MITLQQRIANAIAFYKSRKLPYQFTLVAGNSEYHFLRLSLWRGKDYTSGYDVAVFFPESGDVAVDIDDWTPVQELFQRIADGRQWTIKEAP